MSEVRKDGKKSYSFFWHDVDSFAWEHYINQDIIDANRPSQHYYNRNQWNKLSFSNYKEARRNRKRMQILLACDFLNLPLPNPRKLSNIDDISWIQFVRKML